MTRSTTFTIPATAHNNARNPNGSRIRLQIFRPPVTPLQTRPPRCTPPPRRRPIPVFVSSSGWVQAGLGSVIRNIMNQEIARREIAPRRRLRPSRMSPSRVGSFIAPAISRPEFSGASTPISRISSAPPSPVSSICSLSTLSTLSTLSSGASAPASPTLSAPPSPTLSTSSVVHGVYSALSCKIPV
ncbi:hypothetical protein BDC45DRAFT_540751 [Circinella umbellata]|nr:hypothetical protein BDC45DRAFT_540751 [Circinella umbellata]